MIVPCSKYILKTLNLPVVRIPHIAPKHGTTSGDPLNHTAALAHECRNENCVELVMNRTHYDQKLFVFSVANTNSLVSETHMIRE